MLANKKLASKIGQIRLVYEVVAADKASRQPFHGSIRQLVVFSLCHDLALKAWRGFNNK